MSKKNKNKNIYNTNIVNTLLRSGFVSVDSENFEANPSSLATILMNIEYYGYSLSYDVYKRLSSMSDKSLVSWWGQLEVELKNITGDDRNISDFVVYKNFPSEVLGKTESEYWLAQILMYWGFPNQLFTQSVQPRPDMKPNERKSTMLKLANNDTCQSVYSSLLASSARWKSHEKNDAILLSKTCETDINNISFKENLVTLATSFINDGRMLYVKTATDVLRLAAGLSDQEVSLKKNPKFKSFNRKTRVFLLSMLAECKNIEEDVARRKGMWKRLFHGLHVGDYGNKFPQLVKLANNLYNDDVKGINSIIEKLIMERDDNVFEILSLRPGEFARRIVNLTDKFGTDAANAFVKVLPKLSVSQIVKLKKHLDTATDFRIFPPGGSWALAKIGKSRPMKNHSLNIISKAMSEALAQRVPKIKVLDTGVKRVALTNNGSDVGAYARGTIFKIPEEVEFIRTTSYWEHKSASYSWFDNGWNFFDSDWSEVGACCWNSITHGNNAAIFSGDPTNLKTGGKGAQLIDLYPSKLIGSGVRYAVWNILCYSRIKFSEAGDVFAALQWGIDPSAGKLFEPSRSQIMIPLIGDYYSKFVCVLDIQKRELTYIDANFNSSTQSATQNGAKLSELMPAFMQYIGTLPTVHDLFKNSVGEDGEGYVLYNDKDIIFDKEEKAYVFKQEGDNKFNQIDLNKILNG